MIRLRNMPLTERHLRRYEKRLNRQTVFTSFSIWCKSRFYSLFFLLCNYITTIYKMLLKKDLGKRITYFNKFNAREQKLFSRNDMKPTRMANRNI